MQIGLAIFTFWAWFFAQAAAGRVETLSLPHALRADESASLEIQVGAVPHGTEIEVRTASGQLLGVISPFGVRSGNLAGTYTVPVPPDAISHNHISVRLLLKYYQSQRAPTRKEVKSVRIRMSDEAEKH